MVPDVPAGWVSLVSAVRDLNVNYLLAWHLATSGAVPSVKIDGRLYCDPHALKRALNR